MFIFTSIFRGFSFQLGLCFLSSKALCEIAKNAEEHETGANQLQLAKRVIEKVDCAEKGDHDSKSLGHGSR